MGRHHLKRRRPRHLNMKTLVVAAAAASVVGLSAYAAPGPGVPAADAQAAATVVELSEAERVYLNELAEAGVQVNPAESVIAVEIAREHVAHGHLIGMREWIRQDFRDGIPRLTEEQVDAARVVVEHHFQRVTGRKQ